MRSLTSRISSWGFRNEICKADHGVKKMEANLDIDGENLNIGGKKTKHQCSNGVHPVENDTAFEGDPSE